MEKVCAAAMVVRWCGGEGVCGCDDGAVVMVERVCAAVMAAQLLQWRGHVQLQFS